MTKTRELAEAIESTTRSNGRKMIREKARVAQRQICQSCVRWKHLTERLSSLRLDRIVAQIDRGQRGVVLVLRK